MVAMKNATDNAQQLIKDLTLQYNKLRQSNITEGIIGNRHRANGGGLINQSHEQRQKSFKSSDRSWTWNFPASRPPLQRAGRRIRRARPGPCETDTRGGQHLGDNWVRCVCMGSTEGMKRGYEVTDTGGPISMPVGDCVLGRVFNVVGEPVDERGPVNADKFYPIHRPAPDAGGSVHFAAGACHRHQGH